MRHDKGCAFESSGGEQTCDCDYDKVQSLLATIVGLPNGRYGMRVSEDIPSIHFPPGFSWRFCGKLFVVNPKDESNQRAMGVVVPSQAEGND